MSAFQVTGPDEDPEPRLVGRAGGEDPGTPPGPKALTGSAQCLGLTVGMANLHIRGTRKIQNHTH